MVLVWVQPSWLTAQMGESLELGDETGDSDKHSPLYLNTPTLLETDPPKSRYIRHSFHLPVHTPVLGLHGLGDLDLADYSDDQYRLQEQADSPHGQIG